MKVVRNVLIVALAMAIAGPVIAQEKAKRKERKRPGPARQREVRLVPLRLLEGIELTDEQKTTLKELRKEMGPKLQEIRKKMIGIISDEQRKARAEAVKAAKEAGKTGKELREAVQAAVKLTEEQKAKMAEVRKAMGELQKEIRQKIVEMLTPEQREAVKAKLKKARAEAKKRGKKATEAEK